MLVLLIPGTHKKQVLVPVFSLSHYVEVSCCFPCSKLTLLKGHVKSCVVA